MRLHWRYCQIKIVQTVVELLMFKCHRLLSWFYFTHWYLFNKQECWIPYWQSCSSQSINLKSYRFLFSLHTHIYTPHDYHLQIRHVGFPFHMEFFHNKSIKCSGGKTSELLCNKPICNVLNGMITLQYICDAIQCVNTAVFASCVTLSSTFPGFILHDSLHSKSLVFTSTTLDWFPFDPLWKIFILPYVKGNTEEVTSCAYHILKTLYTCRLPSDKPLFLLHYSSICFLAWRISSLVGMWISFFVLLQSHERISSLL